MKINEIINEHIVKVEGGYRLLSGKGKNLGTFPTKSGAQKHEQEVQYFKHAKESLSESSLPGEYVYHASYMPNLARGLKSVMVSGLKPSENGYGGRGVYFAYDPEGGFYHVDKDQATMFRVKWKDLVDMFGVYPGNPNGIQRDRDEIIVPGNVPASMLEIEYFKDEWWDIPTALSSETRQ
jgi:hypothetical protein